MINIKEYYSHQKLIIISSFIVLIVISIGLIYYSNYIDSISNMDPSHIYVCDNPNHKSDFDLWISEEAKITWVPTYIIIKDGYIIGAFDGDIDESFFTSKLGTVLALNIPFTEIPNFQITNLLGERKALKDIFIGNDLYILELHWIKCKDCIHQDDNYTQSIYEKYSTRTIYRYYIKSEEKDVKQKYNVQ